MRIGMVGTGYVGLVSAVCFAQLGHTVYCMDIDADKIRLLRNGVSPIYEPGLPAMLTENQEKKRLSFSTSLEEILPLVEVLFLAIGTPEMENGCADLSYLYSAAEEIGKHVAKDLMVVIKSTVPVGTCEHVEKIIATKVKGRNLAFEVKVSSNPEFLQEGSAVENFMYPQRIIVGVSTSDEERMFRTIYHDLIQKPECKLLVMDRRTSELTKYAANAILASRVGFINEIARLASKVGADIDQLRTGIGTDKRIGPHFLNPGPGYGGSCFPKDVSALINTAEENNVELAILKSVKSSNTQQKKYAAKKIIDFFDDQLHQCKIAVFGLSFKPGTDDVRESPALTIIDMLLAKGASVYAHDPISIANFRRAYGPREKLHYLEVPGQEIAEMDAIAIITDWDSYKNIDWGRFRNANKSQAIFDFRNLLDGKTLHSYGYSYQRL